jgi:hypothetical protein
VAVAAQDTKHGSSTNGSAEPSNTTFACVGIDTDMNGALVLVTCQRKDGIMQSGLGEDEAVVSCTTLSSLRTAASLRHTTRILLCQFAG